MSRFKLPGLLLLKNGACNMELVLGRHEILFRFMVLLDVRQQIRSSAEFPPGAQGALVSLTRVEASFLAP